MTAGYIIEKNKGLIICFMVCVMTLFLGGCGGAENSYDQGMEMFEKGDYSKACDAFSEAIKKNPDMAEYYIGYGMSLLGLGEYDKAREQFLYVVRDTDNKIVRENNKKAYRGIALTYYRSGVYDQAKGYFETALNNKELDDMNDDLKAYLANCEMYLNNYEGAIKKWTELIEKSKSASDEDYAQYYLGRAKAETVIDNLKDAIVDYKQSIKNDEYCYPAYIGLYLSVAAGHDTNAANDILETALSLDERNSKDSYYKAVLRFYKGDYEASEDGFNIALEKGENEAYFYLGQIKQVNKDYAGAIELYNQYLSKCQDGKTAEYCNQMAGCLMELARYDEASDWISQGIAMAAGSVKQQLMFNEVVINEKLGDYKTAKIIASEYLDMYEDEIMQKEFEYIKTRDREKNQ